MTINFTDVKDNEEVLEVDKSKGIHTPGIISGHTYTDTNGTERYKYEVMSVYTTSTVEAKLQEIQDAIVSVTGLTIDPTTASFEAGTAGNVSLNVTVTPEDAADKTFSVAFEPKTTGLTYSAGKIKWTTAVPAGTYIAKATSKDGAKTDDFLLELTEPVVPEPVVPEPEPEA